MMLGGEAGFVCHAANALPTPSSANEGEEPFDASRFRGDSQLPALAELVGAATTTAAAANIALSGIDRQPLIHALQSLKRAKHSCTSRLRALSMTPRS
jgi:hypothetical protein